MITMSRYLPSTLVGLTSAYPPADPPVFYINPARVVAVADRDGCCTVYTDGGHKFGVLETRRQLEAKMGLRLRPEIDPKKKHDQGFA